MRHRTFYFRPLLLSLTLSVPRAFSGPTEGSGTGLSPLAEVTPAGLVPFLIFVPLSILLLASIIRKRKAEEALLESEAEYRALFENSTDSLLIIDEATHQIEDTNLAASDLFGFGREDLMTMRIEQLTDEADTLFAVKSENEEAGKAGKPNRPSCNFTAKDGSSIPGEISRGYMELKGRRKVIAAIRDISERVKMEEKLRQAHKMEAVGTLTGGIAHDFNNVLGVIVGNAELAREDLADEHPAKICVEEIIIAGMRARDIVRQLMSFSRKSREERHPLDLRRIAREALPLLRSTAPSTVHLELDLADELSTVVANPTQMHQVLINLASNAIHSMERYGGQLTIKLENKALEVADELHPNLQPGKYVLLEVRDTGHGIDNESLQKIFDPYFTTKGIGKGTGLGLAVVHGIMKSHRGIIDVDTIPGKGTTFQLYFPAVEDVTPRHEPAASDKISSTLSGTERILYVDDESSLLQAASNALSRKGYEVTSKISPIEALNLFKGDPSAFELIVTDMTMPHMTGEQLVQEVRKIRNDMPIILTTGYSERMTEEKAAEMDIDAFLYKPVSLGDLINQVRAIMDRRRS